MTNKGAWLNNKTVVVTGASGGLGAGLAEKLIKEHNCYVIGIARSEAKMKKFVEKLGSYADHFEYRLFDVSQKENWKKFAAEMAAADKVPSVLINNAGILPKFKRTDRYSREEIDAAMNINFFSIVYATEEMLPLLLKQSDPAVINVASSASLMTLAGTSFYSASKAALRTYTEALRAEFRKKCYFSVVCPGFTATDIMRDQSGSGKTMNLISKVSTSCDTMVNWIFKGIENRKPMQVHGFDAWAMDIANRLFPVQGSRLFSAVMRLAHVDIFEEVYKD
ncbi:MAG: SDR family NAD(P)-dependent oxidoreductase [Clostridia bacterium]|nr:SDR family NAD(P)-dependent oxidoreductase [Clostridia bacterium]